jgi:hydroxymethylglutaryl-CoA synthase
MSEEKVGIVGYGVAIPMERLDVTEIIKKRAALIREKQLKPGETLEDFKQKVVDHYLKHKAIVAPWEDATVMSSEACLNAINMAGIDPNSIQTILVGSESKPYAVGQIARHSGAYTGVGEAVATGDLEGACVSGMLSLHFIKSQVKAHDIDYGLAVGADVAQAPAGDPLELAAGAGSGAFVIGREDLVATIVDTAPYSTLTLDFWRRDGQSVPKHFGPTTTDSFLIHVAGALYELYKKDPALKLSDFHHIATHQPIRAISERTTKIISGNYKLKPEEFFLDNDFIERSKLSKEEFQTKVLRWTGATVEFAGNTYAASSNMTTCRILDSAKPDENILILSYGSGAYGLAVRLRVEDGIEKKRSRVPKFDDYLNRMTMIKSGEYWERQQLKKPFGLDHPRYVGIVEPLPEFGEIMQSMCETCGRTFLPARQKCLDDSETLLQQSLPVVGKVKIVTKPDWTKRPFTVYDMLRNGYVPLASYQDGDITSGMEVEAIVGKLRAKSSADIIQYSIHYRKRFRTNFPETRFITRLYAPNGFLANAVNQSSVRIT